MLPTAADTTAYTFELGTTVTTVDSATVLGSSAFRAVATTVVACAFALGPAALFVDTTVDRALVLGLAESLAVAAAARAFVHGLS